LLVVHVGVLIVVRLVFKSVHGSQRPCPSSETSTLDMASTALSRLRALLSYFLPIHNTAESARDDEKVASPTPDASPAETSQDDPFNKVGLNCWLNNDLSPSINPSI
jgi:hypothetical protein